MLSSQLQAKILRGLGSIGGTSPPRMRPCRLESPALDRNTSSSEKRTVTARTAGEEATEMPSDAPERLTLPPPYRQHRLEAGSVVDAAVARVAEGAGTLVWTDRPGLLSMAVVLEPETPLVEARRAFHLGMAAACEALAAFCAPERDVRIAWPDTILHDTSRLGGGRLGWPADCGEGEVPAWMVFGVELIRDRDGLEAPGLFPESTSLVEEGFEAPRRLIESFASHLMLGFDTWEAEGFARAADRYLRRLVAAPGAEHRIDRNGDLLEKGVGDVVVRRALLPALAACAWADPATGGPRL
jgi:biotin-(acetyl-CoA carboxylase) ligase